MPGLNPQSPAFVPQGGRPITQQAGNTGQAGSSSSSQASSQTRTTKTRNRARLAVNIRQDINPIQTYTNPPHSQTR